MNFEANRAVRIAGRNLIIQGLTPDCAREELDRYPASHDQQFGLQYFECALSALGQVFVFFTHDLPFQSGTVSGFSCLNLYT